MKQILLFIFMVGIFASCSTHKADLPTFSLLQQEPTGYSRQWHMAQLITPDGDTLAAEIRGRGHSTFAQPKHPYALRLNSRRPLLTLPANRRYVMLANFFDHSLLRNALALETAKQTSLADCTPLYSLVSLNVNGINQGIFNNLDFCHQASPKTLYAPLEGSRCLVGR